jgi:hypothetical protein
MYKNIKAFFNTIYLFFRRTLNISNLTKVIFIFIFGLISRVFIINIYNNVITDHLNQISAIFSLSLSLFIVIILEFIDYFHIKINPSYIVDFCRLIRKLTYMNKNIFSLKMDDLKISSNRRKAKFFSRGMTKITQGVNQSSKFYTSTSKFKIPTTYEMKPFREIKPRENSVPNTSTSTNTNTNNPAIKYTPRNLPPSGRSRSLSNLKAFNADHDL